MSREHSHTRRPLHGFTLRWVLVAALAVAAGGLIATLLAPSGATGQVVTGGRGRDVFVVSGQVAADTYGLYLIDTENGTICVYEYFPGRSSSPAQLRLTAARAFGFDVQLDEYNTAPSPREIKKLVEQHRRLESVPSGS